MYTFSYLKEKTKKRGNRKIKVEVNGKNIFMVSVDLDITSKDDLIEIIDILSGKANWKYIICELIVVDFSATCCIELKEIESNKHVVFTGGFCELMLPYEQCDIPSLISTLKRFKL